MSPLPLTSTIVPLLSLISSNSSSVSLKGVEPVPEDFPPLILISPVLVGGPPKASTKIDPTAPAAYDFMCKPPLELLSLLILP